MKTVPPQNARDFSREKISRREMMKMSAGTLLAFGLWPGALRAAESGSGDDFTFIVVNDLHYVDDQCGAWFERVVKKMNETEKAAFCLVVGDWTEHGTDDAMHAVRDSFKKLACLSYGVIGNHDYLTQTDRSSYDKVFPGKLNYRFEHAGWQIVALDTTDGKKSRDTMVERDTLLWLDENLPKLDRKKPLIVFTHFPLGAFTPGRPKNADDVLEKFRDCNLQAVFNGHFHGFTERRWNNATLTTNKCCAISRKNHDGTPEKGYFICRARQGKITREFVEVKLA